MWLVLFKRHFFGNCFLCSCYLNTTVDTSNWEKFDIQRFWIFQQQEICNFISLTFLVITCDLHIRFWSLVFFSAGCPHSPCEWTSQERQNKFILLSHALSIACGSSDVQAIQKPGILFFFCFKSRAVDNCNWEKLELDLILVDFNNKIIQSFRCRFWECSNLIYRCVVW